MFRGISATFKEEIEEEADDFEITIKEETDIFDFQAENGPNSFRVNSKVSDDPSGSLVGGIQPKGHALFTDISKELVKEAGDGSCSSRVLIKEEINIESEGELKFLNRDIGRDEPLGCKIFHTNFPELNRLNERKRSHTVEKPFRCEICSNSFSLPSTLKKHMRTHTGEKPFKCEICSKSFSQSGPAKQHMRTHTGEKPFKCKICRNSFSRTSTLNNHMRTHTGQKPFDCNICCC